MRFTVRRILVLGLFGLSIAGCSSDPSGGSRANLDEDGGKGAGGKGGGGMATGGSTGAMCSAPTGGDACRQCLADSCCSDLTDCLGSLRCSKALDKQKDCRAAPGAETSACFGDLTRDIQGDAGSLPPIPICIITHCSAACGGPGVL